MRKLALLLVAALAGGPAFAAEDGSTPTEAPAVAAPADQGAQDKPVKKKQKARAAAGEKDKTKAKTEKEKKASEQKPALTRTAYVRLLAAEIKRHTPKTSDSRTGSIHVAFTVGSSGRVVSHKVQSSSNPALEPVVGQILASIHTPPPPGGAFSAVQEFNFH